MAVPAVPVAPALCSGCVREVGGSGLLIVQPVASQRVAQSCESSQ